MSENFMSASRLVGGPELWYVETSAVNYLCNRLEEQDALATRDLQCSKRRLWLMSPVTFLEISLSRDAERRDELLGFAQHLLHDEILAFPEEMIVRFIARGFPLYDPIDDWQCQAPIATAWRRVANRSDLRFDLHQEIIQPAARAHRHLATVARRILSDEVLGPADWTEAEFFQAVVELVREELESQPCPAPAKDDASQHLERLSIFFVFSMFCCLNTIYPQPFRVFWARLKLDDPWSRVNWLVENLPILFVRGPFMEMALATASQFRRNPTRGLIFDVLHFTYLPWVSQFLTADRDYSDIESMRWHPNVHKIVELNKIEITSRQRRIEYPQSLIEK